jgi:ABC-type transport system substrate-binding protein
VIGQVTSVVSLDPHLHDEESTHSSLSHFYERLVAFGPELDLRPELAVAWANPSDTVWRFTLRDEAGWGGGMGSGVQSCIVENNTRLLA